MLLLEEEKLTEENTTINIMNIQSIVQVLWRGMTMGIAEIIPGVSGGTIAFITGIYERLINAISGVSPNLITVFKKEGLAAVWNKLDGTFLLQLAFGMVIGIVIGTFTVSKLMVTYPEPLWAFFFGLIIASVIYVFKQIEDFDYKTWIAFGAGAIIAYLLTAMYPISGSDSLWYVFLCGMIAISALVLPGVSGSFMLLILGMYTLIIGTLKGFLSNPNGNDLLLLSVFALGCLAGLLSFTKVVSYFFKHYRETTLAVLAGFMIGSIHKIWPWRNPSVLFDKNTGQNSKDFDLSKLTFHDFEENYKVVLDTNVFPEQYFADANVSLCIMAAIAGFFSVLILSQLGKEQSTKK